MNPMRASRTAEGFAARSRATLISVCSESLFAHRGTRLGDNVVCSEAFVYALCFFLPVCSMLIRISVERPNPSPCIWASLDIPSSGFEWTKTDLFRPHSSRPRPQHFESLCGIFRVYQLCLRWVMENQNDPVNTGRISTPYTRSHSGAHRSVK